MMKGVRSSMVKLQALGYEYKENGILLTVIYDINGKTKVVEKLYEGAAEINFDWEEEAIKVASEDIDLDQSL